MRIDVVAGNVIVFALFFSMSLVVRDGVRA